MNSGLSLANSAQKSNVIIQKNNIIEIFWIPTLYPKIQNFFWISTTIYSLMALALFFWILKYQSVMNRVL